MPVTLGVFFTLGRLGRYELAMGWLVLASLFFYGWWNPSYVGLLLLSILINYRLGIKLAYEFERPPVQRHISLLILAVGGNLALLAYYKYANFFLTSANSLLGTQWAIGQVVLPLGISFFMI